MNAPAATTATAAANAPCLNTLASNVGGSAATFSSNVAGEENRGGLPPVARLRGHSSGARCGRINEGLAAAPNDKGTPAVRRARKARGLP
jgi:hypothetical protein